MRINHNSTLTMSDGSVLLDGYTSSATITSDGIYLARIKGFSCTISCPSTGSPAGTVKLQGCNDKEANAERNDTTNLVHWFDVPLLTSAVSGASTIVLNDSQSMYRWVRMVYTPSGGSITITCRMQEKGIG